MSVTFSLKGIRVDYESNEGWADFANGNARQIIGLLDIESDEYLCGEIRDLSAVIHAAVRVLNANDQDHGVEGYEERPVRVSHEDGVVKLGRGPQVIYGGTTDESVRRRVRQILDLCVLARREETTVVFG